MITKYYTGRRRKGEIFDPEPLPGSTQRKRDDPDGYIPDPGLVMAANVALILGQPLLLTGEPGVGKTSFAASLARDRKLAEPLRFETKSTSEARDLFYTFDMLSRFKGGGGETNLQHITWNALGEAIIQSQTRDKVSHLLNDSIKYQGPCQSVVLIDEIDKAPRDFPNDLLNEIYRKFFRVPQIDNKEIQANEDLLPILVLTSNSETNLPDAFLRRCIYYHIPFPDREKLLEIVMNRIEVSDPTADGLLIEAIDLFEQLRHSRAGLSKPPSIAELIEWLDVLPKVGADHGSSLKSQREVVRGTLSVLVKTRDDRQLALKIVDGWLK